MVAPLEAPPSAPLPPEIAGLFWEYAPGAIDLERHRDVVFPRVLTRGGWRSVRWLRERYGDPAIREWLRRTHGRHLDRRSLRLCQALFDLPESLVSSWLAAPERAIWDGRTRPRDARLLPTQPVESANRPPTP